jgi:hypothetical protein
MWGNSAMNLLSFAFKNKIKMWGNFFRPALPLPCIALMMSMAEDAEIDGERILSRLW